MVEKKDKDGNTNPKWTTRQQEIETELAARVARLHNGDLCATPSKTCKSNVARTGTLKEVMQADKREVGRQYATRFLNVPDFPVTQSSDPRRQQPVGDYFSLRCVEEIATERVTRGGMEFMPLSI